MAEPNPYKPPQSPEPLKPIQVAKRGLGLLAIILLTPVAVLITGGISCAAGAAYFDAHQNAPWPVERALTIFLVPPLLVLVGMICWAAVKAINSGRTTTKENT
jgi:hypothetical protein